MIGDLLVGIDPKTLQVAPGLAESWTVTPDGRTWTFKLRPNVPFQKGYGTMTADDVKFTWQQYIQPDSTDGNIVGILTAAVDKNMDNFKIISPLEFSVTTTGAPQTDLLSYLATDMVIQSKKYWTTKPSEAPQHPLGTGPFEFVSSAAGTQVVLQGVEHHWRETPQIKNLTIKVIPDASTALLQVESGAVDIAPISASLIPQAKGGSINKLVQVKDIGSISIVLGGQFPGDKAHYDTSAPWVQADNPAKGLAIRQALSYAIDRTTILSKVLHGAGTLIAGPIAEFPSEPGTVDPSWQLPQYDPAKAKQLLAQGGYPDGFPVTMALFESRPGDGEQETGQAVAAMWQAIGIKVKLMQTDFTTIRTRFQARTTAGLAYARLSNWLPSADYLFSTNYLPTAEYAHFYDPVISSNIGRYATTTSQAQKDAITKDIVSGLIKDMRCLPMYTVAQTYATSNKVGSWSPRPSDAELNGLETIKK
jgi:peptide/nickel transport system substrate-binding protein